MDQIPFKMASVNRPLSSMLSATIICIRLFLFANEISECLSRSPDLTKSNEIVADIGSNLKLIAFSALAITIAAVESDNNFFHSADVVG